LLKERARVTMPLFLAMQEFSLAFFLDPAKMAGLQLG
jgi:hypothetical protein